MKPLPPVRRTRVTAPSHRSGIAQLEEERERPPGRAMRNSLSSRPTRSRPDDPVPDAIPGAPPPSPQKKEIRSVLTTRSLVPRPRGSSSSSLWIVVLVIVGFGVSGRGRRRVPRRVQPARRRVQDRLRHPRRASSAARAPASPARSCSEAEQGVDDPAVQERDAGAVRPRSPRSRTSTGSRAPTAEEGAQPDRVRAGRRGRDRSPTPTSRCPTTSSFTAGRRDPRRDPEGRCPKIDGLRIELGGFIFAEFEKPSSEVLGLAFAIVILIVAFGSVLAMGLPVGVALFGIGIGTAHHHAAEQRPRRSPTSPRSSAS